MKHKRPKMMELRSTQKDRDLRKGKFRMVILSVCAVLVAIGIIVALIEIGTDVPVDPNAAKTAQPKGS